MQTAVGSTTSIPPRPLQTANVDCLQGTNIKHRDKKASLVVSRTIGQVNAPPQGVSVTLRLVMV